MIILDQHAADSRRLLRLLRRHPRELERDALALRLRAALKTPTCRDAVLEIVDRTFSEFPEDWGWREIVVRCDVHGEKARAAAAAMHLSLRQFHRCRSKAFEALSLSLERIESFSPAGVPVPRPVYCASCYQRIHGSSGYGAAGQRTAT